MEMNSFTSLKFRSAWMPPAVAHAPMVTRYFEARRTCWMRSASCCVVMEPSTSERSYGPLTTAREASAKLAISISPATASNSSSQSSKLNWQPSQDANFHTASFGLCSRLISNLPFHQQVLHAAVLEYRAVLADKMRPVLAMAAKANCALHVALHRKVYMFRGNAVFRQFRRREAHHDFGATHQRERIR